MKHLGDYDASTVIYGKFTTYRPSTGAAFTLGGTPALSVYKDNSTTQSTSGVTLTADFDSVTGLNHFAVDTSADGTFYSAGSHFEIVITTGTVDSVSVVGSCIASFSLRKDSALKPTVAARTLDVSAGGEAGLDWANIGSPTTAVNLSATNIDPDQVVASVTGAVGSVTGAVGSVTGAVGSVTGNVGGNVTGSVGSVATNGISAASLAADAGTEIGSAVWATTTRELTSGANIVLAKGTGVTGFNDLDAAGVRSAVGLASANLDTQIATLATAANLATVAGYLDTEIAAIKVTTDKLDETLVASSDGFIFTAAALQDAPTGGSAPSAATIAAAVWEEPIASHSGTSGSTAEALAAAGASGDPWITALPGAYSAGQAGYIVGNALDAAISSRASQTSVNAIDDFVDTEVAAIKAVTDKLDGTLELTSDGQIFTALALQNAPVTPAGLDAAGIRAAVGLAAANLDTQLGDLPTNAELATALGTSDDAVLAVLGTPAGASIAADVAAVQSDTNDLQSRLPAALISGRIDATVGAMQANVMTAAAAAADLTTELQSGLATSAALSSLDAKVDVVDGVVDAILVDTAEIGVAGAGLTALATAANLATVAGYLDTEIAAILADTNELQTDWTNGGRLDLLVDAIKAKTDALPASPAAVSDIPTAGAIADAVHDEVVEGTVTLRQSIRLHNSALGGKVTGLDTFNPVFRDLADSKDVIDATVDSYGNRSAVTRDLA